MIESAVLDTQFLSSRQQLQSLTRFSWHALIHQNISEHYIILQYLCLLHANFLQVSCTVYGRISNLQRGRQKKMWMNCSQTNRAKAMVSTEPTAAEFKALYHESTLSKKADVETVYQRQPVLNLRQ